MKMLPHLLSSLFVLTVTVSAQLSPTGATASFKGSLPPKSVADLSAEQQSAIEKELAAVTESFKAVKKHARAADADIFLKAVRYALEFHEWYDKKPEDGVKKATALLDEARKRIESLKKNETPWMAGSGQKVLGFYSKIDDSPQPYGVEIPDGLDYGAGKKPVPMWIWLHGRGDTATDIHFIYSRLTAKKPGQFQPKGTIVIHPFGRYCNGWKSAGETDVFEARDDAKARFNIDENRIALAGFSMGGAGAWHLGAHFADQWACVHTGAGFADVKRYQKLTPDKYPSWYEQILWGVYDVPDYARNFFNVPLISYSGELDAQRDSAEYMMEVLKKEGLTVPHLIGPGMPHKYHPETIKEVQRLIEEAAAKGREEWPLKVSIQTKTVAYSSMKWVEITSLDEHWKEARVDAEYDRHSGKVVMTTINVKSMKIEPPPGAKSLSINGNDVADLRRRNGSGPWTLMFGDGLWADRAEKYALGKSHGLQGPIEDGFKGRFLVVLPDGKSSSPQVQTWVNGESAHFLKRWRGLMRGDAMIRKVPEVTAKDMEQCHLVLWGDPRSNSLIAKVMSKKRLPLTWSSDNVAVSSQKFSSTTHIPLLCFPNPLATYLSRYVILNSGLTFREAHDRTNSLQNPKLPDWAILDITQPPNAETAGKVVAADFFDEHWQVIPRVKSPEDRE